MRGIPYREAVGVLMWITKMTESDLVYREFGDNPGNEYWKGGKKALQCLKRTASLMVTRGGAMEDVMKLSVWVDADHATYPDIRCSISGSVAILCWRAISWFSPA